MAAISPLRPHYNKLKAGDQITATVYDGDYVLHNVKLAAPKK